MARAERFAFDTDGQLPMANHAILDICDSAGVQAIFEATRNRWPWGKHPLPDSAYDGRKLMDKATCLDFVVEIIGRSDDHLYVTMSGVSTFPKP